ncbi:hypothetical protein COLO4_20054 [Corchorus olitorius]|uniref:Uncharacterized protein n=1 Tax=Corchorus olitorius TaxID=93759 RepID=A0A1R3J1X9_9ROSI|nr:hypothetical protein COLO4_20054 [Corchorus olitorius]
MEALTAVAAALRPKATRASVFKKETAASVLNNFQNVSLESFKALGKGV